MLFCIIFLLGMLGMIALSTLIPPLTTVISFVRGCVALACSGIATALSRYARYLESQWQSL